MNVQCFIYGSAAVLRQESKWQYVFIDLTSMSLYHHYCRVLFIQSLLLIYSFVLSFIHLPNHLLIYSMNACLTLLIHQIQFRTHLLIFFIPAFNYSFITLYYQYT